MKDWKKQPGMGRGFYDGVFAAVVFTGFIGFVINQPLLYVPTVLLVIFLIGSIAFDRFGGSNFEVINKRGSVRLFPGDEVDWEIQVNNYSRVPVLNGTISFYIGKSVSSRKEIMQEMTQWNAYKVPFSLISRGASVVNIPIKGVKRGVTKANHLSFRFPHLMNFTPVRMWYQKPFQTEFIVYPSPAPVHGVKEFIPFTVGEQRASLSPYEDFLTPVGTRDYEQGDAFHKIHWKASAKSQTLKTKVLERQADASWTIIVNVVEQTRLGNEHISLQLEPLLSAACYLCYTAADLGYPYELFINTRKPQKNPYFYQEKGEGREHLKKSLEMMARIDKEMRFLPVHELFHWLGTDGVDSKVVLIVGEVPENTKAQIQKWEAKGIRVLQVELDETSSFLRPALDKGVVTYGRR